MIERSWMRFPDSCSDNLKSKIQNRKWAGLSVIAFMLVVAGAVAHAQQPKKVPRIGYLSNTDPAGESTRAEGIRLALRERGYIEGQNIATEYRYVEGKSDRYPELAAELVRLKVDIIVVAGGSEAVRAAKNATKTIPIVMVGLGIDLSWQASLKALPVPAATSPALPTLSRNLVASGWSCSKKPFPNLPMLPFSMIRPLRPAPVM